VGKIQLNSNEKRVLESTGVVPGGITGGPQKVKYYLPDGRIVWAIPGWRGYIRKDAQGKVVESGTRDSNFDRGWLSQPPENPKWTCVYCGDWHDTKKEITACRQKKERQLNALAMKVQRKFNKEDKDKDQTIGDLTAKLERLEKLVAGLVKE